MNPMALGSGEMEPEAEGSGETELVAEGSGETEREPKGQVRRSPRSRGQARRSVDPRVRRARTQGSDETEVGVSLESTAGWRVSRRLSTLVLFSRAANSCVLSGWGVRPCPFRPQPARSVGFLSRDLAA